MEERKMEEGKMEEGRKGGREEHRLASTGTILACRGAASCL